MSSRAVVAAGTIAVLGVLPLSAAQKSSIRFKAVNSTSFTVRAIYVSRSLTPHWGANLLKNRTLGPGESVVLRFDGDCGKYDLRFVAERGTEFLMDEEAFCDDDDVVTVAGRTAAKVAPH